MNRLENLYHTLFRDAENASFEDRQSFWIQYDKGVTTKRQLILNQYQNDTLFIEKELLSLITNLNGLDQLPVYMNLMTGKNNASALQGKDDQGILVDQLLTKDMLSFFILVFATMNEVISVQAYDLLKSKELDGNIINILLEMDESILNLAMDAYWCSWTFIIGHELYHLNADKNLSFHEEEYAADRYGYQVLMNMILMQKEGKIPAHLQVYSEDLYLAPIMCMQYFLWKEYSFPSWFSPESRMNQIFSMFDDVVPDEIDTEQGNNLLNIVLDTLEAIE